jgi:hypothetical protein
MYDFSRKSCVKNRGVGVEASRRLIREEIDDIASHLNVGDFMMFKCPDDSAPFWIGRCVAKSEWDDSCVYRNETTGHMNTPGIDAGIEPVRLSPGEYSINVQWYCQRDIANPLKYSVELEQPFPVVNHYQNLVMGGFEMVQTLGSSVRVPRQRSVRTRCDDFGYAAPLLNLQTREGDWFRREYPNIYTLTEGDRDRGIACCSLRVGRRSAR